MLRRQYVCQHAYNRCALALKIQTKQALVCVPYTALCLTVFNSAPNSPSLLSIHLFYTTVLSLLFRRPYQSVVLALIPSSMSAREPFKQYRSLHELPGGGLEVAPSIWHPNGYPESGTYSANVPRRKTSTRRTKSPYTPSTASSSRPASIFSELDPPLSPTTVSTSYPGSIRGVGSQNGNQMPMSNGGSLGSPAGATFTPVSRMKAKQKRLPWWKRVAKVLSPHPEKYKHSEGPVFVPKPDEPVPDILPEQKPPVTSYGVKWRMNSKTPKEFLPKTWEEYKFVTFRVFVPWIQTSDDGLNSEAYNKQLIDIDDPPEPPSDTLGTFQFHKQFEKYAPHESHC